MKIKNKLKRFVTIIKHPGSLLYPNSYSNARFIEYLRENGAVIGENKRFISPSRCSVDPGRLDYINIGNNCCLSFVTILAHDYSWYVLFDAFNDILPDSGGDVVIGDNVFVGYQACILKGTTIGDNVIIGAKSVVKGQIPSNTVWAGVPAKMICTLEEFYNKKCNCRLNDAVYRREHIKKVKKRNPTIEEMGMFAFLFLEQSEENFNKYISNIDFNGIKDRQDIKEYFFSSVPVFYSLEEFLAYEVGEQL